MTTHPPVTATEETNVSTETTPQPCPHDTIAESAGLRVCLDCGMPNPKRRRTA